MKKNSSDNNDSNPKTKQEQPNLSSEPPKELGATTLSADGNQGALKTAGSPTEPTPETAASSSSNSKRLVDLRAAIPATVPAKKRSVRLDHAFAEDLNRMEQLIFRRTNLEGSPKRMIQAIIAEADGIFDDIFCCYHFFTPANPRPLKARLDSAHAKLAELRTIETRGDVITKFFLTAEEMSKLCTFAEAFSSYFAETYTPRSALKLLWLRGGVLIADNLPKHQS